MWANEEETLNTPCSHAHVHTSISASLPRSRSVNTVQNQYYPNIHQDSYHKSHLVH